MENLVETYCFVDNLVKLIDEKLDEESWGERAFYQKQIIFF